MKDDSKELPLCFKDGQSAGELNFSSASVQSEADEDGVIWMLNLS